ncbi:hypothetical protein IF690_01970 [Pseudomonas sp. SK3(2021)]|uniref:hypothetical protein n=1 Tax=Pseudomonas sp. SK3(2021) TaxID=2841064 RepID=UPI00192AE4C4|nr:hypothetical protein [Pseudomonas sp. SK3(2021)]QQZ42329.1 hypothetical protein IF690_01970 [Pseudomonas sp. SK3(2021)]
MKRVLGAVQLFNATAQLRIVAGGIASGAAQSASDFAAGLGFNVDPQTVGSTAQWAAILFGAGKTTQGPFWSSTKSKNAVENAYGHWDKHKAEFPQFQNAKQYVEGTKSFLNNPPVGTLTKVRPNGDTVFFNPANDTFGIRAADGSPRTMFRPEPTQHGYPTNLDYFNAQ